MVSRLSNPVGVALRAGVRTVENASWEMLAENAQELTPLAIQEVASALNKDMPGVDWHAKLGALKENQLELLATILPLSIIGGGSGTWQDLRNAQALLASPEAIRSTGLAENHVQAITSAAARGDMDAAQNTLRTAYRETDFHSPEVQQRRDAASGAQRERMQRQQAAIAELEKSGALPVMRRTENGWQVRFNSELVDSFDTYAEANAARWEVFEKSGWEVTQSIRDIISGLESTSAIGREYVYRLKDDEMTLGRAVQEKIASAAQLRQRAQIADRNLSDTDAAYDEAAFTSEALSNDLSDAEAARRILGSSRTEFKDGVYQTTITLYKGANELTVLEEKIEGDARLLLKDGRKGWMISALRDVEDKTGVRLFRKVADNSQLKDQDVVEAWSSLGVSYFTATSRKGEASTQGGVRPKGLDGVRTRQFFSRVMGTKMGAVLSAYGTFFREVWKQAAALNKARRDGKLDAELESTLRQQLGLGESPSREVTNFRNVDADANADLSTFTETSFSQLPLRKQAFYWKQQLGKLFAGTLDKTHPLLFGKTPAVLEAVGADPLPLVMDINVVTKAREKHGLSIKQLQDIFEEVHDPIAIFQSHRLGDSQVVLTSLEHHGDPLIVAVHLDRIVDRHKVNKIESVYAKSVGVVKEWLSDGSTLQYLNTKKSHLLALPRGLQLPKGATLQKGRRQYLTEEDIVNLPDRSEFTRQASTPPQTSDTASPESDKKNELGGNTFALAPLGAGFHRITAAPPVVSLTDSYPDTLAKPSEYRSYFWKNFEQITSNWPAVIDTPEGPITWTKSKTGDKLKFFKDGEPAKLHFIAAANLPELLKNSTLAAVQKEGKADETVAEVHRRYAWAEFPDGTRRHILLTVDRMSELARPEQQLADRAYSSEVLGVSIEILPKNKGADAVNLKEPSGTSPSGDQALTSAQRELNRFLAGIKPEHKPHVSNTQRPISHSPVNPDSSTANQLNVTTDTIDNSNLLADYYLYDSEALQKAHAQFGGPQGLLRSASEALGETTATNHSGDGSQAAGNHEVRALKQFAQQSGLYLDSTRIQSLLQINALRGGVEHRVAIVEGTGRVIKDVDAHALATQNLYDYLTDHELSNHFFYDDIRIEGFYEHDNGRLHIITSQPFRTGIHPDWDTLNQKLEDQGFTPVYPGSLMGAYYIHDKKAGDIEVIDLHPNNVVVEDLTGIAQPIDAHFLFDDIAARKQALEQLGLRNDTSEYPKGETGVPGADRGKNSDTSAERPAFDSPPNDSQGRDEAASSSEGQSESPFYVSERTRQIGHQLQSLLSELSSKSQESGNYSYHWARLTERARKIIEVPVENKGVLFYKNMPEELKDNLSSGKSIVERFVNAALLPLNVSVELVNHRAKAGGMKILIQPTDPSHIVAHELMHSIERQFPHVLRGTIKFLEHRTKGDVPVRLKDLFPESEYRDDEYTLLDQWKEKGGHPYSGKFYKNALGQYIGTEILSTGIERLQTRPLEFFRDDPEFFNFVITTLQNITL